MATRLLTPRLDAGSYAYAVVSRPPLYGSSSIDSQMPRSLVHSSPQTATGGRTHEVPCSAGLLTHIWRCHGGLASWHGRVVGSQRQWLGDSDWESGHNTTATGGVECWRLKRQGQVRTQLIYQQGVGLCGCTVGRQPSQSGPRVER